jgi:excisionase family DNA binding protein
MTSSERFGYAVSEAAEVSGVGRTVLYDEIRAGRLTARKIGRRTVILRDDLMRWLRERPVLKTADNPHGFGANHKTGL